MMNASRIVLMLLTTLTACAVDGSTSSDDIRGSGGKADHDTFEQRWLSVGWSIVDMATNQTVSCPPGFDTVTLTSQRLDAAWNPVGAPVVDLYDCADASGWAQLWAGRYQVWIDITSHDGTSLFAQSTSAFVDLGDNDQSVQFAIMRDGGYFSLAWNLVGADTNQPLYCDDVFGLDGIELAATLATTGSVTSDIWYCEDGWALTAALPAGSYTVSLAAVDTSFASLGTAPALWGVIQPRNQVTHLGDITIPIDGL